MASIDNIKIRDYTPEAKILEKHSAVVNAFRSGRTQDLDYRKEQLRNLYYAVKDNEELFKQALQKDLHRSPLESEILELHLIYAEISTAIENVDKWAKDQSLGYGDIRMIPASPVLRPQPYGSVLILAPWNYPLLCSIVPVASAIAAGNVVVLKPTEMDPYTTEVLTQVLENALDPRTFQIVLGAVPESTVLLAQKWDKIMVTGSCGVGRIVSEAAAKHLTPVALELGGKSPVIVTRKANLDLAAKRIAWGKFTNAGQTCVAPDYVVIDEEVQHEFVQALIKYIKKSYPNLTKNSEDYAHIVNERLWARANKQVAATKGRVEFQWGTPDEKSKFFPPTIVTNVTPKDPLMEDELFNPILPIIPVGDAEHDAGAIISQHDHPLALYVFTSDKKQANRIINTTRSGSAVINDVVLQAGSSVIPFGGVGSSGSGRYHGKFGFDEFSHLRPILNQSTFLEPLLKGRYAPYRPSNVARLRHLAVPKAWFPRSGKVRRSLLGRLLARKFSIIVILAAIYLLRARL